MAAYDSVPMPGAPAAPNYAAPLLDFKPLSQLGEDYFKGTQAKRTMALQNAFKEGLPRIGGDPNGPIDINAMTETLAKLGGADAAMPLLNRSIGLQIGQQAGDFTQNPLGGGQQPQAPQSNNLPAPPPRNVSSTGAEARPNANDFTLNNFAARFGITDDSPQGAQIIKAIADRTGVDPTQVINDQGTKNTVANLMAAATRGGQQVAQAQIPGSTAPLQPTRVPTQSFTQGNELPADYTEANARKLQAETSAIRAQATRYAGAGQKDIADKMDKEADAREARSKQILDALAKRAEQTVEQKNAAASGERSPIAFEGQKAVQAANIKHSEALEGGIQSMANASATMLDNVRLQKSIVNNPEFYSGPANEAAMFLKRAVPSLAGSPAPMELYRKILNANMLHMIDTMKASSQEMGTTSTRIFSAQIDQIEKASGTLDNSPTGLRALAEINDRTLTRNIQIADIATAYKQGLEKDLPPEFRKSWPPKQTGILDANFEKGMRDWMANNPLLTAKELANPKTLGETGIPKGPPVGTEQGGFKFKGGDYRDKNNWIPLKQELRM